AVEGQFRDEPDAFQRGLDSPFGAVLVRGGKPEIGQDAVAHVAADAAVKCENCAFATALKCAHDVSQVLGVEPAPELGRADHVAEDNRKIPPLRLDGTRRGRRPFLTRQLRHSRPFRQSPEETLYRYFTSFFRDAIISRVRSIGPGVSNDDIGRLLRGHVNRAQDKQAWNFRKNRRIDDAQSLRVANPEARIEHGVTVVISADLARPASVVTACVIPHKLGEFGAGVDMRARELLFHEARGAAGNFTNEFDAGGEGVRILADIGRRRVEVVEIDDRPIEGIVRGKLQPAGAVLRVALQDAPGEVFLFVSPLGIPGPIAGKVSWYSEYKQVRVRLAEIRSLDHR